TFRRFAKGGGGVHGKRRAGRHDTRNSLRTFVLLFIARRLSSNTRRIGVDSGPGREHGGILHNGPPRAGPGPAPFRGGTTCGATRSRTCSKRSRPHWAAGAPSATLTAPRCWGTAATTRWSWTCSTG